MHETHRNGKGFDSVAERQTDDQIKNVIYKGIDNHAAQEC